MGTPPVRRSALGIFGRIFATLFFLVFFGMGACAFFFFARSWLPQAAPYRWTTVKATVDEAGVIEPTSSRRGRALYVKYHYNVDGRKYQSDRYEVGGATLQSSEAYRLSQKYVRGSVHPCYVNPSNPGEAVLHRQGLWFGAIALFPLVFVAVGAIGIISVWSKKFTGSPAETPVSSAAASTRGRPRFLLLFFGAFLVIGAALTYVLALNPLMNVLAARNWPEVPCEVLSSRLTSNRDSDGTTYSVDILYHYRTAGQVYTGSRYSFVVGSSSGTAGKNRVVAAYPPGRRTVCFVNPRDPTDAVLNRGLQSGMALGLLPLIFFAAGLAGIVWTARKPSAPSRGWSLAAARSVQSSPMTTVDFAETAGSVALSPKTGRWGKVFALLAMSLFWNGIVSVFLFQVVVAWSQGRGSIFETLFMTPFLLIGLGLLAATAHQALSLANPVAHLTLSRAAVRLGEGFDLEWHLTGNTARLHSLRIELEGREEAAYRRGTSTSTDRSTFARITLIDTQEPAQIRTGTAHLKLASDTMHSFAAPNNKIVWSLRVKASVPRWPDIDDEYPLTVLPHSLRS